MLLRLLVGMFLGFLLIDCDKSSGNEPDLNDDDFNSLPCSVGSIDEARLISTCEGCEGVLEFPGPDINHIDTLPGFDDAEIKLKVTGKVYKSGGTEPACGVVLYIYHTNKDGVYPTKGDETGWGQRHGYLRGWIKTNEEGEYTFYTLKPGNYDGPAHIHPIIFEPNGKYYWIDDYWFADDPLVTKEEIESLGGLGGGGNVLELIQEGELSVGYRDIELGKNVPGYE